MKNILICTNPDRDIGLETAEKIEKLLEGKADTTVVSVKFSRGASKAQNSDIIAEKIKDADMVVSIGGDGTIMHTLRAAAPWNKPVIGVNKGNKGFLAEIDEDNIKLLLKAVEGDYTIDERIMLDVAAYRNGERLFYDYAINDASVKGISRLRTVTVSADEVKITSFAGDGVVVASPTGSTAYSLSAGGPIVEPGASNIIVTPVCAHVLGAKSFVLSGDRTVSVRIDGADYADTFVSVDGNIGATLQTGDIVTVKKSEYSVRLIKVTGKSFYETVSEKLGDRQ